jgi:hypothetical protein
MRHALAAALTFCAALVGCTHQYGLDRHAAGGTIRSDARVYVAQPQPGKYDLHPYPQSGRQTRDAVAQAFAGRVAKVDVGVHFEEEAAALATAQARGDTVLVLPVIEHWEEHTTESTGIPDRIAVRIWILDVATGKELDSALVTGKSRWLTFGGSHPQDLLPRAVGDYVALLLPATAEVDGR